MAHVQEQLLLSSPTTADAPSTGSDSNSSGGAAAAAVADAGAALGAALLPFVQLLDLAAEHTCVLRTQPHPAAFAEAVAGPGALLQHVLMPRCWRSHSAQISTALTACCAQPRLAASSQ